MRPSPSIPAFLLAAALAHGEKPGAGEGRFHLERFEPPAIAAPAGLYPPKAGKVPRSQSAPGHTAGFDSALFEPLDAYAQVRSAGFAGWADTGLYIGTQIGRYPQVHHVAGPGGDRRQVTFFPRRISTFDVNPVPARRNLLYSSDAGGDEQFRLSLFDLAMGQSRSLGMPPGRADGMIWNDSGTAFAYAHVPAGTDRWDLRLGRTDGSDTLLLSLAGAWSPLDLRPDGKRLLAQLYVSAAEAYLYALDIPGGGLTLLTPGPAAYVDDAVWVKRENNPRDTAWEVVFASDREGEAHRLYRLDPNRVAPDTGGPRAASGERGAAPRSVVLSPSRLRYRAASDPVPLSAPGPWDVEWVSAAPDRRTLAWSVNEEGYSRIHVLAPGLRAAKALSGGPRGLIQTARFRDGSRPREFAATVSNGTTPGDVWVCDWTRDRWTRWTYSEAGGLPEGSFRPAASMHYPSLDPGLASLIIRRGNPASPYVAVKQVESRPGTVPAFLYLPDSAVYPGRRPVLIQIHGGPEMQARPGFDPYVQFLVGKLGYAVILPNVRGSSGYGKSWLKADDGFKRMGAVRDIGALLDWIGTQPRLDPSRVAVSGRSYGGFMSLASLVEYGPRLQAGISAVGISHFPTFLKHTSGYRRDLRRAEYGDERDPRMAAFLDSISPLTRADRIRTPLMLVHGRNDPRVPYGESERIFAAVRKRGIPAWFLTFEDEGHGVRDQDDQKVLWRAETEFLARRLGAPEAPAEPLAP